MRPFVFNLDDFCEEIMTSELWQLLFTIKRHCPLMKVTMFTIPLLCSEDWLMAIRGKYDWIEMHYHGTVHKDRDEWFGRTSFLLPYSEYFFKGFKAPWWRMDQQTADLFNAQGFLISSKKGYFDIRGDAVYRYNEGRCLIPDVAYDSEEVIAIHSHVQSQKNKDGLPDMFDDILKLLKQGERFVFVSELNLPSKHNQNV